MRIELISHTELSVCDMAIAKCWDTKVYSGDKRDERIDRVGNKNKHGSILEHLVYSFDISGVSRALLQEKARHRIASLSVKSTRYTLKELKNEEPFNPGIFISSDSVFSMDDIYRASQYLVFTGCSFVDDRSIHALEGLRQCISAGISNDIAKFCLPESYKTSYVWTVNARSLQNFLGLRLSKSAMWEIRKLATEVYKQIPEDHKFIFDRCLDVQQI